MPAAKMAKIGVETINPSHLLHARMGDHTVVEFVRIRRNWCLSAALIAASLQLIQFFVVPEKRGHFGTLP